MSTEWYIWNGRHLASKMRRQVIPDVPNCAVRVYHVVSGTSGMLPAPQSKHTGMSLQIYQHTRTGAQQCCGDIPGVPMLTGIMADVTKSASLTTALPMKTLIWVYPG